MAWGEKEKTFSMMNIFFMLFTVSIFFVVFVIVAGLMERNLPGVYKTCTEEMKKPAIYSYGIDITSQADAENVLSNFLLDKNITFTSSSIDECGSVYSFNAAIDKYAICSNGEIYKYWLNCRDFTLFEKIKIALKSFEYMVNPMVERNE